MVRSIDLSKATKLKDVTFVYELDPRWVVGTLRTITSDHQNLQEISVEPDYPLYDPLPSDMRDAQEMYSECLELDYSLVKLCKSHSIRVKVLYTVISSSDLERARSLMDSLFPESAKSGVVELISREFGE